MRHAAAALRGVPARGAARDQLRTLLATYDASLDTAMQVTEFCQKFLNNLYITLLYFKVV